VLDRGFLTVGRWGTTPIRLHWSLLLALLFFVANFALGAAVGYVAILLFHEVGHALLVRRCGLRVGAINIYVFGGECQYFGQPSPLERAVIAWGGVLAQLLLLAAADVAVVRLGAARPDSFARQLTYVLGAPNAFILLFNLLPIGKLDGREAWMLFPRIVRRLRTRRRAPRRYLH
jgi:Zn-dependent protease